LSFRQKLGRNSISAVSPLNGDLFLADLGIQDCPSAYESYASCNDLMHHLRAIHPNADILDTQSDTVVCIFCNEPLLGSVKKRFNHLGRHMEEISFAIVPKNHEDWEFYNDSDTANEADGKYHTAPPKTSVDVTESKLTVSEGFTKPKKSNTYTIFKPKALPPQVTTTIDPLKPGQRPESLQQASPSFVSSSLQPDEWRTAANFNLNSLTASDLRARGDLTDTDAQKVSDAAISLSTQLDRKEAGKKGGVVDQWMSMMRPTARAEQQRGSFVDSDKSARKQSRTGNRG
jgi:hypothetical protein